MTQPNASPPPDRSLPSLPAVVARLVSLYASPDYTPAQVADLLATDPPLSARVLRLANSAYYGFSGKVDSVRRAVVLLGAATVQAVALGTSLLRPWGGDALPAAVEALWVHSYLCGLGCRFLAQRLPLPVVEASPDGWFLAGLLHDVGKIVFLTRDPPGYVEVLDEELAQEALRERERALFGRDHAEEGAALLEAWQLPTHTVWLARYHHRPGVVRPELEMGWEALDAAHRALRGEPPAGGGVLPAALASDLAAHLDDARGQAESFYRAIS
ncbi:MAG: hypothetical protein Kow0092_17560 [Deferrisomatales bacterium]